MQFPPFIETDDQLRTYDTRNIKINTYIHEKSETIGSDELRIEKFSSNSFAGDISFAYDLPLYETGYKGYGSNELVEGRVIKVDGATYTQGTSKSDNSIEVQPESGYTYRMMKNSTVFMVVGGNQT